MKTPAEIYKEALAAGNAAVKDAEDDYPCGFATLNIKPARGPFVTFLKENKIGRKDEYNGGYTLSSYDCCSFRGQNVDIKTNGCIAFQNILKENGITAYLYSRLD